MTPSRRGMSIMLIYIRYNVRTTVLTVDGTVHSWSASVCYTSRCNVSEVSIDLSDVECIEWSNALAVSNGRCAGNRSSDGQLRFRKLPIRYRGAPICKNGNRRWLMREWLENSILRAKNAKKRNDAHATGTSAYSAVDEFSNCTKQTENSIDLMPWQGTDICSRVRRDKKSTIVLHHVFPVQCSKRKRTASFRFFRET